MDTLTRPFRWLWAQMAGYFWAKCERCGRGFGGFEWTAKLSDAMQIGRGDGLGHCVYCPSCAGTRDHWEPGWRDRGLLLRRRVPSETPVEES